MARDFYHGAWWERLETVSRVLRTSRQPLTPREIHDRARMHTDYKACERTTRRSLGYLSKMELARREGKRWTSARPTWTTSGSSRYAHMTREQLEHEIDNLRQLAVDADAVSRSRFEYYGLCDSIDNCGRPYPSQWSADLIRRAHLTHQTTVRRKHAG